MSKEQEAFKIVYNNIDYLIHDIVIEDDAVNVCLITIKEQLPTLKQALNRLESIDNADPSEALERLEEISKEEVLFKSRNTVYMGGEKSETFNHKDTIGNYFKGIEDIKQALLKAQEQLKENELLKEIIKRY